MCFCVFSYTVLIILLSENVTDIHLDTVTSVKSKYPYRDTIHNNMGLVFLSATGGINVGTGLTVGKYCLVPI